jgi:hypothetical protein
MSADLSLLPLPPGAVRFLLRLFERHRGDRAAVLVALKHQAAAVQDDHRFPALIALVEADNGLPEWARAPS